MCTPFIGFSVSTKLWPRRNNNSVVKSTNLFNTNTNNLRGSPNRLLKQITYNNKRFRLLYRPTKTIRRRAIQSRCNVISNDRVRRPTLTIRTTRGTSKRTSVTRQANTTPIRRGTQNNPNLRSPYYTNMGIRTSRIRNNPTLFVTFRNRHRVSRPHHRLDNRANFRRTNDRLNNGTTIRNNQTTYTRTIARSRLNDNQTTRLLSHVPKSDTLYHYTYDSRRNPRNKLFTRRRNNRPFTKRRLQQIRIPTTSTPNLLH